jgi:hypothetical protein
MRFETKLVTSKARLAAKIRYSDAAAMSGKCAGSVPSLRVILWHFPYN